MQNSAKEKDIYMEYANIVKRFLISLSGNADLAEDLTQETFYQAYKSIHRYNGNCKMSVWLCQIVLPETNAWIHTYGSLQDIAESLQLNIISSDLANYPESDNNLLLMYSKSPSSQRISIQSIIPKMEKDCFSFLNNI